MQIVIEVPLWVVRFWPLILLAAVWDAVWKVISLWKAGRNGHLAWFICLCIFNTLGILPIIYIFAFSKKKA